MTIDKDAVTALERAIQNCRDDGATHIYVEMPVDDAEAFLDLAQATEQTDVPKICFGCGASVPDGHRGRSPCCNMPLNEAAPTEQPPPSRCTICGQTPCPYGPSCATEQTDDAVVGRLRETLRHGKAYGGFYRSDNPFWDDLEAALAKLEPSMTERSQEQDDGH